MKVSCDYVKCQEIHRQALVQGNGSEARTGAEHDGRREQDDRSGAPSSRAFHRSVQILRRAGSPGISMEARGLGRFSAATDYATSPAARYMLPPPPPPPVPAPQKT
jgi:hypothetical protein